jgi:3-oxoacyl-[acyl-carrier-protein] synthase-3
MKKIINNLNITGIASCVPKNVVHLTEFYDLFGEKEVNRITLSTGIRSIRVASLGIKTSDLCIQAAINLMNELEVSRNEIDGVIFVSQTPDFIMPATSCILQYKLGLKKDIVAFDINYGCSGYIYGLLQSALLISSKCCKKVLLCVGDTISKHIDPKDHKSRLVFGDGVAVSIIECGNGSWSFDIKTDGSGYQDLIIPRTNTQNQYLYMNGSAIMEFAMAEVKGVIDSVLEESNKAINDLSTVVLHQANYFMLNYLRKKLNINKNIFPIEVDGYGNIGPASIPMALCSKYSANKVKLNNALFAGFGVGLSWGATYIDHFIDTLILPIIEL